MFVMQADNEALGMEGLKFMTDMIRISVGLESIDDILWDISQALTASQET